MACEDIELTNSPIDFPFITIRSYDNYSAIQIFSSSKWRRVEKLQNFFVSTISHESVHDGLLKYSEAYSEAFDEIGSVSTLTKNLKKFWQALNHVADYYHGVIGIDRYIE